MLIAIIGAVCLVAVAAFRVDRPVSGWLALVLLVVGLSLSQFGYHIARNALDLVPVTPVARMVKGEGDRLRAALVDREIDTVIIMTGSSLSRQGVDPDVFEAELSAAGRDVLLVKLAMGGAGHFERNYAHRLFEDRYLAHLDLDGRRVVFMDEVDFSYDETPLSLLDNSFGTERAFAFIDAPTALQIWHQTRSLEDLTGDDYGLAGDVTEELFRHGLANMVFFGGTRRYQTWDDVRATSGTNLNDARYRGPRRSVEYTISVVQQTEGRLRPRFHWYPELVENRIAASNADLTHMERVWYVPPTRTPPRGVYGVQFCRYFDGEIPCLNAYGDIDFMTSVTEIDFWKDYQHFNRQGAEMYSRWLAQRLLETNVLAD